MPKNYYEVLEVQRDVGPEDLKKAYRKLAKEWHPDVHQGTEKAAEAEEKFKSISEAYAVLSDETKRRNYDATGSPDARSPFGTRTGGFYTTGDAFEIFRRTFGGFDGFEFSTGPQRPRPMKGQTVQGALDLSLKEALFGTECKQSHQVVSACEKCGGTGAAEFEICEACQGAGGVTQQQENMVFHQTCGACRGQGRTAKTACDKCGGSGSYVETKTLTVAVPKGIKQGTTLRLAGQGGRGFNGGPPGDVMLKVQVSYPDLELFSEEEREQFEQLLSK